MRRIVLALLISALSGIAVAQIPKRPITHEDVWLMRRLGGPVVSPDGRWAIVAVEEPAYEARNERYDLWILSLSGEAVPRRITVGKTPQLGIAWSPDSQKIAFSSKREGDDVEQIYLLNLKAGGEAERITRLAGGARAPLWNPDGHQLLFSSSVYVKNGDTSPDAPPRRSAELNRAVRVYENFPIRSGEQWRDSRHTHLFVQEASGGGKPRDLLEGTSFAANSSLSGEFTAEGESFSATWTPDGGSVLFIACVNTDALAYSEINTDLFLQSADGGEPVRLTSDPDRYGMPVFAPDGKSLVLAVTAGSNGYVYNLRRLARYPWPFVGAERTLLTKGFDRAPEQPVISGDGARVYFTAEDAGGEKLYSVPTGGGPVRKDFEPPTGVLKSLAGGGDGAAFRLVALEGSAVQPPEVVAIDLAERKILQLTRFNAERVEPLDLFPVEHFWLKVARGGEVHSLVVRPPNFDPAKKYPLVALVHDGPQEMARDAFQVGWNAHLLAASGSVVVVTNYRGSSGFGEDFARALQGDPLKGPAEDVDAVVSEVLRRFAFTDATRVAAVGVGYGGHLVNWLQATTTRYRCLVAHAGTADLHTQWTTSGQTYDLEVTNGGPVWEEGALWREQSAVHFAGNHAAGTGWVTPTLLSAGMEDFRVPLVNTLENWTYLQRLHVPSRLLVFPGEGHRLDKGNDSLYWNREVQAWLKRWFETQK